MRELTGDPVDLHAFLMNVTVVDTSGFGWLTIYEAGTALPDTSNINRYGSDQTIVNNCYTWLRPSDSGIEVACGGAGSTHFLLDLIGVLFDHDPGSALTAQAGAVPASLGGRRLTGPTTPALERRAPGEGLSPDGSPSARRGRACGGPSAARLRRPSTRPARPRPRPRTRRRRRAAGAPARRPPRSG